MTQNILNAHGYLNLTGHEIYWQEKGNPQGQPLLIVHGGPGGQLNERWGEFFDSNIWRIIFFDQRGCGRSRPFGSTQSNTPMHLVEDIEALRQLLGIEKWTLFGGSWGTTLSILYGLSYPNRCAGFLLRGVWLARAEDISWFVWGSSQIYPQAHEALCDSVERIYGTRPYNAQDLIIFSNEILKRPTRLVCAQKESFAQEWFNYEMLMSTLKPGELCSATQLSDKEKNEALSIAKLETHFLRYELPLRSSLIEQVKQSAIKTIPCTIVHGQYDMVCPFSGAYALHKVWPNSSLTCTLAGHYTFEAENEKALYAAAQSLGAK